MKKTIPLMLMVLAITTVSAQTGHDVRYAQNDSVNLAIMKTVENRDLKFDSVDLKIIQKADAILSDTSKWNKMDDRVCDDDIATGKFSLYCAMYKASLDVDGKFDHRKAALQVVRFTVEKHDQGRVTEHRMKDWNNHPATTFAEVKKVLRESIETVKKQLK